MVVGLVVVAGRVVTLEGVTTVRVTVLLGLLVVEVAGLEVVVVVIGLVLLAGASVLEVVTLELAVGLVVLELLGTAGCAVTSAGLDVIEASVRAPVTTGLIVEGCVPPLLEELPEPVVPESPS